MNYCNNHSKKEAVASCINCGNFFCADCLIKVKKKNYCKDCSAELLSESSSSNDSKEKKTIIFQQQQQQSTSNNSNNQPSSTNWQALKPLAKWLIGLFVILLSLGMFGNRYYIAGILYLALGLYWIPPIQDKVHALLKEQMNLTIPTWLRNLVSLILFFVIIYIRF